MPGVRCTAGPTNGDRPCPRFAQGLMTGGTRSQLSGCPSSEITANEALSAVVAKLLPVPGFRFQVDLDAGRLFRHASATSGGWFTREGICVF